MADVRISFRIAGLDEVQRAMASIGTRAQRVAVAGARAQAQAAQEGTQAVKKAGKQLLTDAEARAAAEVALINRVNRARTNALKGQIQLQDDLADAAKRVDQAQERAARAANKRGLARDTISGGARGAARGVGMIVGGAVAAGAAFGTSTVIQAGREQMALDERAALLRNSSGKSQKDFDSVAIAKRLSSLTGTNAGEVMGGFEKLAGKAGGGGLTEYVGQFEELAKIARGAGISMDSLGDTLGTLYNRGVKADSVVQVIEALVQQGKDGAVEFSQLATLLDASSGALGKFKMGDGDRIMTAGGLSQFARTFGKKSGEEATNAVEDLARDLGGKADVIQRLTGGSATTVHVKGKKTKKLVGGKMVETTEGDSTKTTFAGGVEVGTDATRAQLRDLNTVLPDIIEGVVKNGNAGKLMGEGGIFSGNATAIAGPLLQAFTSGITKDKEGRYQMTKDGETAELTGRAAVEALLKQFQSADVKAGTSRKAFDEVMATPQAKLAQAMETLKNDLGTKLSPAIVEMTPKLVQLGQAAAGVTAWAIEHPYKAGAAFLALNAAMGAAQAGLGGLGKMALDALFPKVVPTMNVAATSVNVAGGAPLTAASTSLATSAAQLGAAAAILGATYVGGREAIGRTIQEGADLASNTSDATNLAAKIRHGGGTAEDRERAELMAKRYDMQGGGFFDRMGAAYLGTVDRIKEDGVSASSIARVIASAPTAWVAAAQGGDPAATNNAKGAAHELRDALAGSKLQLDPNSPVQIANAEAIGAAIAAPVAAAIAAQGLQGPKVQGP